MQLPSQLLVALTFALAASAQASNYTTGLAAALNAAGLTTLASVLGAAPAALLTALQQGNHTVFAPSNTALQNISPADVNIANILSYHVTVAPINATTLNSSATFVRTALGTPPAVLLPANLTQVLEVTKAANGTVSVSNAGTTIPVVANTTFQNLNVYVIDSVLQIPGNLSTVTTATTDLSSLVQDVTAALPSLIPTLEKTPGITLFAPINSAITAIQSTLATVNASVLTNVLLNHVINGTAVYSSLITNGTSYTSAGGESLTFTVNTTGVFVTSGNVTAKVVTPNVLTSNGVVHLIDTVLLNTQSNPAAASSAEASAASNTGTASATGAAATHTTSSGASLGAKEFINFKLIAGVIAGSVLGASLL